MHFFYGEIVDLLEICYIAQFKIMERETIEAVSLRVNVHRAVVSAPKIKI